MVQAGPVSPRGGEGHAHLCFLRGVSCSRSRSHKVGASHGHHGAGHRECKCAAGMWRDDGMVGVRGAGHRQLAVRGGDSCWASRRGRREAAAACPARDAARRCPAMPGDARPASPAAGGAPPPRRRSMPSDGGWRPRVRPLRPLGRRAEHRITAAAAHHSHVLRMPRLRRRQTARESACCV